MNYSFARTIAALTGGLVVTLFGAAPSSAQALPNWRPGNICAQDSARGQCLLFERRAQYDVAASWRVIPEAVRSTCLTRFTPPLEPSWRILGDCIEIEGRRALAATNQAREDAALAELQRRAAQETQAAERKRIEDEEASFMARLAEQRRADQQAAAVKSAAQKSAAAKAEAERQRVLAEEASFMALLAEQRRADEAARQ